MIGAYDKCYLEKARTQLGVMLDYSANALGLDPEQVYNGFVNGSASALFEQGDPWLIAGKSGVELCYYVLGEMRLNIESYHIQPEPAAHRSREYWAGWAVAYYQWKTGMTFREITNCISLKEIIDLYEPYHEMDILQFVDVMNEYYRKANTRTRLQYYRNRVGLSQRELAEQAEVPLRTLQQYEQRQKNINKARAEYLIRLGRVLCVRPEDLAEKTKESLL